MELKAKGLAPPSELLHHTRPSIIITLHSAHLCEHIRSLPILTSLFIVPFPHSIDPFALHKSYLLPISSTMSNATAPTSRTREKITGDEEAAADLKLGEFQNVPTLTLSEARLLINAVMEHRKQQRKVEETE